jgi:D-alanyl-D-alanine carboxypeptidase/D-alanyl-D-alanine-endopeptidase (penicillin-binding protein 4)
MRGLLVTLGAVVVLVGAGAASASAQPTPAQQALSKALTKGMHQEGAYSGAYVLDLTTGEPLFSSAANTPRLPASVEKLYTTSTALLRFGPTATFTTSVLGVGYRGRVGKWVGSLYLRGGGDPTFGSAGFDYRWYRTGASVQRLVRNLISSAHITGLMGRVYGDASYFDALPGTSESGFQFDPDLEGSLSALAFNRGVVGGGLFNISNPAVYAAQQLVGAMRALHLSVAKRTRLASAKTPPNAHLLAVVRSPTVARLIALTNAPSDNFFAEMLLKDLGARFGGAGTSSAGAAVVRSTLSTQFGIHPRLEDGSGLSRYDRTTTRQVVTALQDMANDDDFVNSLAVAGETGTLEFEMNHTAAQGRCRGKTGTLHDVSNLVGYCQARDGHTLAFAFLMNSINPDYAHPIQDKMAIALARYNGSGTATTVGGVAPTARRR